MAAEQGPMAGFRDMLAEQMFAREYMIATIQQVYESYGFVPLKTPALERLSTLTGKYGDEGDHLMYSFKDNGGRDVALRYDQTVPLARVVGQHQDKLPMPYKRYTVAEAWRGEKPQKGRYREFTQFDADIVGSASPMADAEIIAMMSDSMDAFGVASLVRVNNRLVLDGLAEKAGITDHEEGLGLISIIDKVDKIGSEKAVRQVAEEFGEATARLVEQYLGITGSPTEKLAQVAHILDGSAAAQEGINNLTQVFEMLEAGGYGEDKVIFDHIIARGLSYYTGIVYETTLTDLPELGSVCGGGRFDNLIRTLGGPDLPAVGAAIGVDRLYEGLYQLGKLPTKQTNTEVLVTNFDISDAPVYQKVAAALRAEGIATEVYYEEGALKKQLKFADRLGLPFVVFIGSDEIEKGVGTIRSLASGKQIEVPLDTIPEAVANMRLDESEEESDS